MAADLQICTSMRDAWVSRVGEGEGNKYSSGNSSKHRAEARS